MFYKKSFYHIVTVLLLALFGLTACGELEFGVETKVSSGRPSVTVVSPTSVAEIPENMVLVTVTPSAPAETPTASPTVAITETPTATETAVPTETVTPTPTATATAVPFVPTRAPIVQPSPTPTPFWPEITVYPTVSSIVWPGDSLTVEYEARGISAALCLAPVFTQDWTCYSAPTSGPYTLEIDEDIRTNLQLELRVNTAEGGTAGGTTALLYCNESAWFFTGPPATCPAGPAVETAAAYQRFEHGTMLWLEAGHWWDPGNMIYVLYDAPNYTVDFFPEYAVPDSDDLDQEIEFNPPEGLMVPESGFGLVWRANSRVRQQLGWALAEEEGFTATVQREWSKQDVYLYLLDFEDNLLVLNFYDGIWAVRSQP